MPTRITGVYSEIYYESGTNAARKLRKRGAGETERDNKDTFICLEVITEIFNILSKELIDIANLLTCLQSM